VIACRGPGVGGSLPFQDEGAVIARRGAVAGDHCLFKMKGQ
jgi:hypothetical protein